MVCQLSVSFQKCLLFLELHTFLHNFAPDLEILRSSVGMRLVGLKLDAVQPEFCEFSVCLFFILKALVMKPSQFNTDASI